MFSKKKKGFSAMLNNYIGLLVILILIISVVIPTVSTAITDNNTTINGTLLTIVNMIPLMVAVGGLVLSVSAIPG